MLKMSIIFMSPKLDRFTLDGKAQVGAGAVSTLLKVDAWASSIQSGSTVTPSPGSTACEVIEQLAQAFVGEATGIEMQLLRKSLLEAFFYCVGLDTDLTAGEITNRLKGFIIHRGKSAFIQRFLSLYIFNYVLLLVGEPARAQGVILDMKRVERMCHKAVMASYRPQDVMDPSTAETLIHNIQAGLQELMNLAR
jgi:hypothetical protein